MHSLNFLEGGASLCKPKDRDSELVSALLIDHFFTGTDLAPYSSILNLGTAYIDNNDRLF